ncbi:LysR family transcriptional regulator [Streptomyces sp. NPDC057291]|uniref:LysR family transcriptional regulator n=1 Tax=Streptomyces sp. NPDC057291 TaxID=3346087 RepID=UPI00364573D4
MTPRQSRPTHLANLDLNLLVTLRGLLRERNVTRAARNLGVTQPAVSASLSRLRRHFADELLVRVQGAYVLTPLAAQLAGQVETVCAAAERLFATGTAFDPATTQREFTLLMADYPATVLGPALSRLFDSDAPHAALHLQLVRETLGSGAGDTIRLVDGLVSPSLGHFRTPGVGSVPLFRDRCGGRKAGGPDLTASPFFLPEAGRVRSAERRPADRGGTRTSPRSWRTLNHPTPDFRSTEGALSAGPPLQHSGNRPAPARRQQGNGIRNLQFVYAFGPA